MNARRLASVVMHVGTVAILLATAATHAGQHGYALTATSRFSSAIAYLVVLMIASYAAGLPDAYRSRRTPVVTAVLAAASGAIAFSVVQLTLGSALLPRFVIFTSAVAVSVWWSVVARMARDHLDRGTDVDRVLFVGNRVDVEKLRCDVACAPERPTSVVGCVSRSDVQPIGPGDEPLVDLAIDHDATVLVLGRDAYEQRTIVAQASTLHEAGIRVRTLEDFYDQWLGKLPVSELQRTSLMFDISEIHGASYARVKRMLDVIAGLLGCLGLLIAVPFVLLGNIVGNRGRLLYRQTRVGRAGQTFEIIKFRTMREGASREWTTEKDPRITPFGRLLRSSHLDELPQCVNILRGDLSIVGPRPEQPQYVAQLAECLPFYELRHLVRPGLTGWAQVKFGYAASEHDALDKLQYDFYYLGHQSLALDMRIMLRTLRTVTASRGR